MPRVRQGQSSNYGLLATNTWFYRFEPCALTNTCTNCSQQDDTEQTRMHEAKEEVKAHNTQGYNQEVSHMPQSEKK